MGDAADAPDATDAADAVDGDEQHVEPEDGARKRPSRQIVRIVIAIVVIRTLMAWAGDIFFAWFIPDEDNPEAGNPLLLVLLNTRKRYLLLAKDEPVLLFFGAAMASQLLMDPLFYLLGRWYGDAGKRWMERQFGSGIRSIERAFEKASYPLVAIMPNAYICLLAGAASMNPVAFFVLNLGGTIVAIGLARWVGDVASSPLDAVFSFLAEYRLYIFAISFVVVGIQIWQNRKQASIESLEETLEEEVERE